MLIHYDGKRAAAPAGSRGMIVVARVGVSHDSPAGFGNYETPAVERTGLFQGRL